MIHRDLAILSRFGADYQDQILREIYALNLQARSRHSGPAVLIGNRELVEMGFEIPTVDAVALVAGADGIQQRA